MIKWLKKIFCKEEPEEEYPPIKCEKHDGNCAVNYSYNGVLIGRHCYLCWVEKGNEGLVDYK